MLSRLGIVVHRVLSFGTVIAFIFDFGVFLLEVHDNSFDFTPAAISYPLKLVMLAHYCNLGVDVVFEVFSEDAD